MRSFSIGLALFFIAGLGVLVALGLIPTTVQLAFVGASLVTYAVYWWDKSAARNGKWRTPENTLHLLALLGGWPGALVAQQTLRHKTQKHSFQWVFWLTVLINILVFSWFFSSVLIIFSIF